jgi:hypothetical protein
MPENKIKSKAATKRKSSNPKALKASTPAEVVDALTGTLQLIERVRCLMRAPDVEAKTLERLMARESRLLGLQGQLEQKAEYLKDRIVGAHPDWVRTRTALLGALQPYPEAADAVIEALKDLGV